MRIAQIAPLTESVPPKLYGGTERIVSYLTEELTALGHDVTLFASGDSVTSVTLEPMLPRALRFGGSLRDSFAPHMVMLEKVYRRAHEFDVLHVHLVYWPFSLFSRAPTPFLATLHGRLDQPAHPHGHRQRERTRCPLQQGLCGWSGSSAAITLNLCRESQYQRRSRSGAARRRQIRSAAVPARTSATAAPPPRAADARPGSPVPDPPRARAADATAPRFRSPRPPPSDRAPWRRR